MERIGVLIANGSEARFYTAEREGQHLQNLSLAQEFLDPLVRHKEGDITSDHSSHRETRTDGTASQRVYGSFPEPTDPKEFEMERFAREIAKALEHGRTTKAFDSLILFAPPHFHGMLNKHLGDQLSRMVERHVEKDYTKVPDHELLETVRSHA